MGPTKLKERFGGWPDLVVKLDIYHFMRRLASGCTKDAHPLYPVFMAKLSCCIFEWDSGDVALLRRAKKEQLKREGLPGITDQLVDQKITKNELSRHCRRRTRGEQQTILMIGNLLSELMGVKGRDLLGVLLLDQERMQHIWQVQRKHVKCIQDEPGVLLYAETGTTTIEGIVLPNYRCARGSTSLESFHLHLNRFIPGTSANSLNFQLYLLEGLNRWNQDRKAASLAVKPPSLLSYSGDLVHFVNTYSVKVLGRKLVPSFQPSAVYTGELIGIDYLYRQTGRAMQDVHPDSEETDQMLEDVGTEADLKDEGFEDAGLDPTIERLDLSSGSSAIPSSSAPVPSHPTIPPASLLAAAATAGPSVSPAIPSLSQPSALLTYTGDVVHSINTNRLKIFCIPSFSGELIGVDYLLRQTGQPLQEVSPDSEDTENLLEDLVEEGGEEDEGFQEDDTLDPTVSGANYNTVSTDQLVSSIQSASCPQPPSYLAVQLAVQPSSQLAVQPSSQLAVQPSSQLAVQPSSQLAVQPSSQLAGQPSSQLAGQPSSQLAVQPSSQLAVQPSSQPAVQPVVQPESPPDVSGAPTQVPDIQLISTIMALWQDLLDFDKSGVCCQTPGKTKHRAV
ncbi:hypothetical protein N1851_007824 [Merluccius polli]|uniref:Uncharacterized protein n=1 Tax=Merluccius polli TaxID=89951 RepID=A0AA47N267_MERPO|nr:hypothetical protein N1851_007824 [Merluccius polli]